MPRLKLTALAVPALLAACTVGPDFKSPGIPLANSFAEGAHAPIGDAAAQQWWLQFNDKMLNQLVAAAMRQNLDVRTALVRIDEAQAAARATGLAGLVSGGVTGQWTRQGGDNIPVSETRSAGFNPSIIIDLFGSQQRQREAALANLRATELSVGTARLAVLSALVSSYLDLRYFQQALALTRGTISSQAETLELVRGQFGAGASTQLDVAQAEAAYNQARANLPGLESGYYSALYSIATLLAVPVQTIQTQLQAGGRQPNVYAGAGAGIPADLLRNRPDVRSTEESYAAAVARVGVSEAALYPSLSLGGNVGISNGVNTWSFGPTVSIPLLNMPVLLANRDQAIAQAEQARLAWRASVLGAVEEVQSSQSAYIRARSEVSALQGSVTSFSRVVDLSQQTYDAGATTLLDLLNGQRSLSSAQLSLAASVRDMAANWAALQVAAGRGWAIVPPATN